MVFSMKFDILYFSVAEHLVAVTVKVARVITTSHAFKAAKPITGAQTAQTHVVRTVWTPQTPLHLYVTEPEYAFTAVKRHKEL